jgi:hypothetical protein
MPHGDDSKSLLLVVVLIQQALSDLTTRPALDLEFLGGDIALRPVKCGNGRGSHSIGTIEYLPFFILHEKVYSNCNS